MTAAMFRDMIKGTLSISPHNFSRRFGIEPTATLIDYNFKLTKQRTGVSAVLSFITRLLNLESAIRL